MLPVFGSSSSERNRFDLRAVDIPYSRRCECRPICLQGPLTLLSRPETVRRKQLNL